MLKRTPLNAEHRAAGAKLVDFGGWEMPLHYGSQLEEHHRVRRQAGVFDVSHMGVIDVLGRDAEAFLRYAVANDAARLALPGQALYTCLLNETGGTLDDLVIYFLGAEAYRVVVNAGTATQDLDWLNGLVAARGMQVALVPRGDLALLAVQGPSARALTAQSCPALAATIADLRRFTGAFVRDWFVARTGYTGEDGLELIVPAVFVRELWSALIAHGIAPCGLGARDTLRLEAGLNLYGHEMDGTVDPYAANLGWTVSLDDPARDFVGRAALLDAPREQHLLGLVLRDAGVLRAAQAVRTAHGVGITTSGSFAPTLGRSIALARVPCGVAAGDTVEVDIRGQWRGAIAVPPRFVRDGHSLVERYLNDA